MEMEREREREREGQLMREVEVKIEKEAETVEAEAEAEVEAEGGLVETWRVQRFSTITTSNGSGHGVYTEQSVGDKAILIERGTREINVGVEDIISTPVVNPNPTASKDSVQEQDANASTSINIETTEHGSELRATELYFEALYNKPGKHAFYCPNCKACIDKVLLQSTEGELIPRRRERDDYELRCPSCFEFLKPIGDWIFRKPATFEPGGWISQKPATSEPGGWISQKPATSEPGGWISQKPATSGPGGWISQKPATSEPGGWISQKPATSEPGGWISQKPATSEPGDWISQKLATSELGSQEVPSNVAKPTDSTKSTEGEQEIIFDTSPLPPTTPSQQGVVKYEILKSLVYGGLIELITSLGVVTSAASADATTLNIVALALANLITGVFLIGHNLQELKNDQSSVDRYQELLGQKRNFVLHASVAILSFLVFGLVPPVVYGFSFYQSDNRNLKIAVVAAAALLCITVLAIVKAYTQKPSKWSIYITTILYYLSIGIGASGISYLAGYLVRKLIEKLGWFESSVATTQPLSFEKLSWASY
ncbi:hypothetical protein ACB094_12G171600 [Castanea mollissima]